MSDEKLQGLSLERSFAYHRFIAQIDQASLEDVREAAKYSYRLFLVQQQLVQDWAKGDLPIIDFEDNK